MMKEMNKEKKTWIRAKE